MITLAKKETGMNWEIAGLYLAKIQPVLEDAKQVFPHECEAKIVTEKRSDGGPYACNTADFYDLIIVGPENTDPRFVQGIKDMMAAVTL